MVPDFSIFQVNFWGLFPYLDTIETSRHFKISTFRLYLAKNPRFLGGINLIKKEVKLTCNLKKKKSPSSTSREALILQQIVVTTLQRIVVMIDQIGL